MSLLTKIFGTHSEREVKIVKPLLEKINKLEETVAPLTDEQLCAKTTEFRERLKNGESKDSLLPEAYAVVREATKRVLGQRHYDVQILGGIILHQGRIVEMRTGEGKTQTELLPAYLNALDGEGVHIVTVNDYLAKRDSEWMGQVFRFLGMTVGCILNSMSNDELHLGQFSFLTLYQLSCQNITGLIQAGRLSALSGNNKRRTGLID